MRPWRSRLAFSPDSSPAGTSRWRSSCCWPRFSICEPKSLRSRGGRDWRQPGWHPESVIASVSCCWMARRWALRSAPLATAFGWRCSIGTAIRWPAGALSDWRWDWLRPGWSWPSPRRRRTPPARVNASCGRTGIFPSPAGCLSSRWRLGNSVRCWPSESCFGSLRRSTAPRSKHGTFACRYGPASWSWQGCNSSIRCGSTEIACGLSWRRRE